MAVPKGKTSKARKHARSANWKVNVPAVVDCPHCHEKKVAHHSDNYSLVFPNTLFTGCVRIRMITFEEYKETLTRLLTPITYILCTST